MKKHKSQTKQTKNPPMQFIDILKKAREEKAESLQIPYRMKNGKIAKEDQDFFHLLSYQSDNDPLKVIDITENKLVVEIYYPGICNMLDAFEKLGY